MSEISRTIDAIRSAAERLGLPELSRASEVPYTTLRHWQKHDFRPKVIDTFEKLATAAERQDGEP